VADCGARLLDHGQHISGILPAVDADDVGPGIFQALSGYKIGYRYSVGRYFSHVAVKAVFLWGEGRRIKAEAANSGLRGAAVRGLGVVSDGSGRSGDVAVL
jgi:hypothetical protein